MKKAEFIAEYGEAAYKRALEWNLEWQKANPERARESTRKWHSANPDSNCESSAKWRRANPGRERKRIANWRLDNPERVEELNHEQDRKGGKRYLRKLEYDHTGLRGERSKVRRKHARMWQQYKKIIAPDSVIHHCWRPGTAGYDGVALVEKDQHQYGIIDVIQVLDGEIKVFTEQEIREKEHEQ